MLKRTWLWGLLVLLAMVAMYPIGVAQETAIIQATANVTSSLSVIGTHNLQFGTVTPGVNKSVDKNNVGSAGEWTITGNATAEVTVEVTLPDSIPNGTGTSHLRLQFTGTDASWDDGSGGGQTAPAGTIDPAATSTLNIGAAGTLMVWLGGTALPTVAQTGGAYSGDVVLTVTYTGN